MFYVHVPLLVKTNIRVMLYGLLEFEQNWAPRWNNDFFFLQYRILEWHMITQGAQSLNKI